MYFDAKKMFDEVKEELFKLCTPLFTYHEIIDRQERFELNYESDLERALREKSLQMAKDNHRKIHRIIVSLPICNESQLFRLLYEKMYFEIIKPVDKQDYTYDYLCLVNICRNSLT